jgi:soluble lytic murein transglycosylase-like protein
MVIRAILAGALLAAAASPAGAQTDWSAAGGGLFPVPPPQAEPPGHPGFDAAARLTPPIQPFDADVAEAARRHGLDPKLLHALVVAESSYRPAAVSPAGAVGLTQLMPATARDLGVRDRRDPRDNLAGGADYLARQLLRFADLRLAVAAYNAGPERVARLGRVPKIPETEAYVATVIDCYLALAAGRTVRRPGDCRNGPP